MQSRGSVSPPTDEYGLEQSTNQREVSHPANLYQPSRHHHHHHHSPSFVYIFDFVYMPISPTAKYNTSSSLTLDPHPPLSNCPPPPLPCHHRHPSVHQATPPWTLWPNSTTMSISGSIPNKSPAPTNSVSAPSKSHSAHSPSKRTLFCVLETRRGWEYQCILLLTRARNSNLWYIQ